MALAIGVVLMSMNESIARLLAQGLPWSAEVPSAGTNVPSFSEVAPTILWRSGTVMLVFGFLLMLGRVASVPNWLQREQVGRITAGLVVLGTGLWYGWLAHPHNAFPSNARFHWVDYLTYDSGNFFYAAGRLPHMLFYEAPYVWQGITAAITAGLCYVIARQLGLSTWTAVALAGIPAVSGNVLLFANTAEDVLFNIVLLLGIVSASLARRPLLTGVALALAVLGRPSFIVFTVCMVGAELVRGFRGRGTLRDVDWRYASIAGSTSLGITVAAQVVFTILGERYFLVNGRILDTGTWDDLIPREVDGFTIFPFSGAYFLHFLWVIPFVLIVGAAMALLSARRHGKAVEATVYLSAMAVVAHLLIHEAKPTAYYNVRYLTYVLPFVLALAFVALTHPRLPRGRGIAGAIAILLMLGTSVFPARAIEVKRNVESRPDLELLEVKDELRSLVGDRRVVLAYGNRSSRNYVAYVLRGNINRIVLLAETELAPGDVVISTDEDPWSSDDPLIRTDTFLVFETNSSHVPRTGDVDDPPELIETGDLIRS